MSKSFEVIFREFADSETFVLSRGLLEDYKRQAAQVERERIIKLIPEYMATVLSWGHETASKQLIALINGENK